ncbi:hypothetical protein R6Z07F_017181 [Ovis aries]
MEGRQGRGERRATRTPRRAGGGNLAGNAEISDRVSQPGPAHPAARLRRTAALSAQEPHAGDQGQTSRVGVGGVERDRGLPPWTPGGGQRVGAPGTYIPQASKLSSLSFANLGLLSRFRVITEAVYVIARDAVRLISRRARPHGSAHEHRLSPALKHRASLATAFRKRARGVAAAGASPTGQAAAREPGAASRAPPAPAGPCGGRPWFPGSSLQWGSGGLRGGGSGLQTHSPPRKPQPSSLPHPVRAGEASERLREPWASARAAPTLPRLTSAERRESRGGSAAVSPKALFRRADRAALPWLQAAAAGEARRRAAERRGAAPVAPLTLGGGAPRLRVPEQAGAQEGAGPSSALSSGETNNSSRRERSPSESPAARARPAAAPGRSRPASLPALLAHIKQLQSRGLGGVLSGLLSLHPSPVSGSLWGRVNPPPPPADSSFVISTPPTLFQGRSLSPLLLQRSQRSLPYVCFSIAVLVLYAMETCQY